MEKNNNFFWIVSFITVIGAIYWSVMSMLQQPKTLFVVFLILNIVALITNIICFTIDKKKFAKINGIFFQRNSPTASEILLRIVKYASHVKCTSRVRRRISFHIERSEIFHNFPKGNYFTFGVAEYFTLQTPQSML